MSIKKNEEEEEENIILYILRLKNLTRKGIFHTKLRERIFPLSLASRVRKNWLNRHLSFGLAFKNVKAKVLASEMEFSSLIFRQDMCG